jgi:RHS repeat-associated protein
LPRNAVLRGDTTSFTYDAYGNLVHVRLADGTWVEYLIDATNRRIGKRVNGVTVQKFLYSGDLRIVAELDSSDQVVARYVYAGRENVPEYMVRGGTTYRLVLDHLGSVRLVVDASTGAVAQRLDYDEYGRVLFDNNVGFQPFGFAGGLVDQHTQLMRFGARDFDRDTGRWLAPDPAKFEGGGTNLYAFCVNNPINFVDPTGLYLSADHYAMSSSAARQLGYSKVDAHKLAQATAAADKGTQSVNSYDARVHAMSGYDAALQRYQTKEEAFQATKQFISVQYVMAKMLELVGDMEGSYTAMGFALHAAQDQWAPGHNFQEWHNTIPEKVAHGLSHAFATRFRKPLQSTIHVLQGDIGAAMRR